MKKSFLTAIMGLFTLGTTSVYGQFVNPVVGGNVMLTTTTNNVIIGPLPTTPTNLYLNSTASPTTTLSIDNNYTDPTYPQYSSRYSGINFNILGNKQYRIYTSTMPACPSGYFHVSPIAGPGIHMNGSTILFSDDATLCNSSSLAIGKFMFDGTIGTSSINIGYALNLPANYKLLNAGTSYFKDKVVIGTTSTALPTGTHKLYVGGSIICEELVVKLQANWPDYVFAPDYTLMPLGDVKKFIAANSHLPGLPAACEIAESGVATSEMLTIQMKKIEELTLYLIQMEERIKQLEAQNQALQNVNGQ